MDDGERNLVFEFIDRKAALIELSHLHYDLALGNATGTLTESEENAMFKRCAELMCIVQYYDILQAEKALAKLGFQ